MTVRYRVVPAARDVEFLLAVRDALPHEPGSVDDCCGFILDRADVTARESAREWLVFLRALGLAAETGGSYYRADPGPDRGDLPDRFLARVYGARELLAVLETEGPLPAGEAAECVREAVSRADHALDTAEAWPAYVRRLLEWGVVFGHLAVADGGYRTARS